MTDCKEIDKLIQLKEGETLNYEFKSSLILQNQHWKEKVLKELIAFAIYIEQEPIKKQQEVITITSFTDFSSYFDI